MLIRNGLAALPGQDAPVQVDIRVEGERFAAIGPGLRPLPGEEVLDAAGLLVLPGGVDAHVHFDTPGFTDREDFYHGSAEAARGGVTCVVDMPCTSLPPVVSAAALETKLAAVAPLALVDYGFYGGVHGGMASGDLLEKAMAALAPRVLGFKAYLLSGMDTFPRVDHETLGRAIRRAAELDRPLLLHAEDADYVGAATARVQAARRAQAGAAATPTWDDYADSRPHEAENVAVAAAIALARGREAALHVVHVGSAWAAEALAAAGASCETCTHYLAFTRADFAARGAALKTAPPVKDAADRDRLWELLAGGQIAFVTSDHAPARWEEKRTGSVWTDYGGIPGVGTRLPYLFSEGYLAGRLSLSRFVDAVAGAPARRFGLAHRKGSLAVGRDADFVLIDPAAATVLSGADLYSKGTDTPFDGLKLQGALRGTWLRGRRIYAAGTGIAVEGGYGQFITRGKT